MTADRFSHRAGIRLKLTSMNYRWPGNRSDGFEAEVFKLFEDRHYPKGKEYTRTGFMDGRQVVSIMATEYAKSACLQCHGGPKGEKDVTSMKKEGYREGDLAGAISFTIPVR